MTPSPTSARPMAAQPDERAERTLGWLFALGGGILILDQTVFEIDKLGSGSPLWNGLVFAVAGGIVLLAVAGRVLPMRALQACWRGIPVLYVLTQISWAFGYRGELPVTDAPWSWTLEPAIITMLILVMRPAWAVTSSLLISLLPACSSWLVWGEVPAFLVRETFTQLPNVIYVTIFLGILTRMKQLRRDREAAREGERQQLRADANAAEQARVALVVHDEVLSALSAAVLSGPSSQKAAVRRAAASALQALDDAAAAPPVSGGAVLDTERAGAVIADCLRAADNAVQLAMTVRPGAVPHEVARAAGLAGAEALRNSLRHGGECVRTATIELADGLVSVTVRDDGAGFDTSASCEGLGITRSIVRRMDDVCGWATVESVPGEGTTVNVRWTR